MTFDIYALENWETHWSDWDIAIREYTPDLIELFEQSPEGKAHEEKYQYLSWSYRLVDLGFTYQEVPITQMDEDDIKATLFWHFPRKISLSSPDDADDVIPELVAFWQFLKREYDLVNAEDAIAYLQKLNPKRFKAEMNNPANFGMARSFLQGGLSSGFDMTSQAGADAYMEHYNASLNAQNALEMLQSEAEPSNPQGFASQTKKKAKNKRRNVLAKAARKRNRKKNK